LEAHDRCCGQKIGVRFGSSGYKRWAVFAGWFALFFVVLFVFLCHTPDTSLVAEIVEYLRLGLPHGGEAAGVLSASSFFMSFYLLRLCMISGDDWAYSVGFTGPAGDGCMFDTIHTIKEDPTGAP